MSRGRANSKLETRNPKLNRLVLPLVDWFAQNARDLPWRRTRDPYAIWVSEIMLQQTQVNTVVPYWKRWMRELPTIESLANASSRRIHKLWEGLGYYTRVRNMQKATRFIVQNHGGRFPERFADVLALPGIGRYTAGAICSIAFNQPTPILDGNVIRVLTRLFGIAKNPRERETNALLWRIAQDLVTHASRFTLQGSASFSNTRTRMKDEEERKATCSILNQSLMELGALICTPRQPQCEICPVARHCMPYRQNRVGEFPNLSPRVSATRKRVAAFVVERRGRFLVRQRPTGTVNAHLWEFPNVELNAAQVDLRNTSRRVLGFMPRELQPLCSIQHSITRYRITLTAFAVNGNGASAAARTRGEWLALKELRQLPFPSAHRKIVAALADPRRCGPGN